MDDPSCFPLRCDSRLLLGVFRTMFRQRGTHNLTDELQARAWPMQTMEDRQEAQ